MPLGLERTRDQHQRCPVTGPSSIHGTRYMTSKRPKTHDVGPELSCPAVQPKISERVMRTPCKAVPSFISSTEWEKSSFILTRIQMEADWAGGAAGLWCGRYFTPQRTLHVTVARGPVEHSRRLTPHPAWSCPGSKLTAHNSHSGWKIQLRSGSLGKTERYHELEERFRYLDDRRVPVSTSFSKSPYPPRLPSRICSCRSISGMRFGKKNTSLSYQFWPFDQWLSNVPSYSASSAEKL